MLSSLQFTLMVPAMPAMPAALGISVDDASWMITATMLAGTVATPIMARLADLYGARRMLVLSIVMLGVGSVIGMLGSTSFVLILLARALQGFATCITPIGASMMHSLFDRRRAMMGVALMSATLGIGSGLGLPLSGIVMALGGLRLLFALSAVGAAVFTVLLLISLPKDRPQGYGRFDLLGAALLATGLLGTLLALSKGAAWGVLSVPTLAWATIGVAGLVAWFFWEKRSPSPLVNLATAADRQVMITNIAAFFASFAMFGNHLLTMQEARTPDVAGGLGLDEAVAGLILLPFSLSMIVLAPLSGRLMARHGGRPTLGWGAAIMAAGFLFRIFVHDSLWAVVAGGLIVGIGTAFAFASLPTLILDAVPASEASAANGFNALIRSGSGAVAGAALGFLLVSMPATAAPDYLSEAGLITAFTVMVVFLVISAALAFMLPRRSGSHGRG